MCHNRVRLIPSALPNQWRLPKGPGTRARDTLLQCADYFQRLTAATVPRWFSLGLLAIRLKLHGSQRPRLERHARSRRGRAALSLAACRLSDFLRMAAAACQAGYFGAALIPGRLLSAERVLPPDGRLFEPVGALRAPSSPSGLRSDIKSVAMQRSEMRCSCCLFHCTATDVSLASVCVLCFGRNGSPTSVGGVFMPVT